MEIWSVVIGLIGCAVSWNHDEQFVEGDFPYYPYNRIDADDLTDSRIRSNEFSGFQPAMNSRNFQDKRKSLYAFNKDSDKLIDASKLDVDELENIGSANCNKLNISGRKRILSDDARNSDTETSEDSDEVELNSAKSEKSKAVPGNLNPAKIGHFESNEPKSVEHNIESAKSESTEPNGSKNPHSDDLKNPKLLSSSGIPKEETDSLPRIQEKTELKPGKSSIPGLTMFHNKRQTRNSGHEANFGWSHALGESDSRDLLAHGISRVGSTLSPRRKIARENEPGKSRKLTLVAPYETNFTGGGFHSVNPSSWLAKEIERFIKRKDHRFLDFMKNTGMDVKKYSGVVSEGKRQSANTKKTCVNCLQPSSAPTGHDDAVKFKTNLLINKIDSLLADLNQCRSTLKNGWLDMNNFKKSGDTEKHRLRRGIRFSRLSASVRPPARPPAGADLVENDLRDLRKNVVLYQNQLPEQEMQALEAMKLHIKVYVEGEKAHEKEDHRTRGSDVDYNESYPQEIQFK